ncbi:MAG: helix-turn-helix protein, partial [uncultured bacterium]
FTLAHELGHLIFHQGGAKYYVYQPFVEDNELEKAAHGFASAFLMPEGVVKATVKQLGITANGWTYDLLLSIKSRFGVSAEAFLYRLFDLELISKKQREFIKSQIDDFYKDSKYQEPSPTSLVLHENQRLKDLLLIGKNISAYEKEVKEIEKKLISLGLVLF